MSLFDEFEVLRQYKQEVTFGLLGALASLSLFFCTTVRDQRTIFVSICAKLCYFIQHGVAHFSAVSTDAIVIYSLMHLLLLLAVLWVYGRERFQRDIEFMLGQPFASWKVFILRFIAPIFLLWSMVCILSMYIIANHILTSYIVI